MVLKNSIHELFCSKDEYYKMFGVVDAEYSKDGLFDKPYKNIAGPDTIEFLYKKTNYI